ncbi:MAG: helix-turn-helix transcriptional regulator [Zetaproteobacteria bacterium]|nr:helix-turn-helix transcriptional regulator [Zetaproteobacteria bacterium]
MSIEKVQENLSDYLRNFRKVRGMLSKDMASRTGCSVPTYSKIESPKKVFTRLDTAWGFLNQLAQAVDASVVDLVNAISPDPPSKNYGLNRRDLETARDIANLPLQTQLVLRKILKDPNTMIEMTDTMQDYEEGHMDCGRYRRLKKVWQAFHT